MTLVELAVASAVMSLVAVVLGGLIVAIDTGRSHVRSMQESTAQGRFVLERIREAILRTGTYQVGTRPTVPGVAVVWNDERPEILVLWTGGRFGSLAGEEPLARQPRVNELVIYTPDPDAPTRLVEVTAPTVTDTIDFTASWFSGHIRSLISSSNSQKVTLCDRIRIANVSGSTRSAVRFELEASPTDDQLAITSPETPAWQALPWAKGISTASSGLRQIAVRIELQIAETSSTGVTADAALPVFGVASTRYEHRMD